MNILLFYVKLKRHRVEEQCIIHQPPPERAQTSILYYYTPSYRYYYYILLVFCALPIHKLIHLLNQLVSKMASPSDHQATVIDGKAIAQTIRSEIASEVSILSEKYSKVSYFSHLSRLNFLLITISYLL